MSRVLTPLFLQRLIYSKRRDFLLRTLVAIALTWTLMIHLFLSHQQTVPVQKPLSRQHRHGLALHVPKPEPTDDELMCQSLDGLQDIFVIMRTGASESLDKLPVHFNTTLRCLPRNSYGIWSDLEETIDGYHIQNALDEVSPSVVTNHKDFEYYRRLQENGRAAFSDEELYGWSHAPNSDSGRDSPGWRLDKWKFLPMALKAHRQRPDAKWYIFTEPDGHINWTTFLSFLSRPSSSSLPYVGRWTMIGDVLFAYGGASFVVSNQAMNILLGHYTGEVNHYEEFTGNHWAGDCVLGKALKDVDVDFTQAFPNFCGENLYELDYASGVYGSDPNLWCYNAMTWHHMSPADIAEFAAFEQKWNLEQSTLLRHGDVFRHFIVPKIGSQVEHWDNLSSDEEPAKSLLACHGVCKSKADCTQFAFHHASQTCRTSSIIKLGHARQREDEESRKATITSGWMMDRVEAFMERMDATCHGDGWILQ